VKLVIVGVLLLPTPAPPPPEAIIVIAPKQITTISRMYRIGVFKLSAISFPPY
jgi:hypothetical protein